MIFLYTNVCMPWKYPVMCSYGLNTSEQLLNVTYAFPLVKLKVNRAFAHILMNLV